MAQTTYNEYMDPAHVGLNADTGPKQVDSFAAEGDVDFGVAVVEGTDPVKQVQIPSAASEVFMGIAQFTYDVEQARFTGEVKYADKDSVNVVRKGKVWVQVDPAETSITPNTTAYFRHTGGNEGKFRTDADGGNADLVPTGIWRSTLQNGLAILEINLP